MQHWRNGVLLCLGLALALNSCRKSTPPVIPICIGDGFGGADCIFEDGHKGWMSPTELKNAWITTQSGMEKFSSWCYNTSVETVKAPMEQIKNQATEDNK